MASKRWVRGQMAVQLYNYTDIAAKFEIKEVAKGKD